MADYRSDRQFGNHRPRKKSFGGRGDGDREMFEAVCVNCGNTCRVPFKPTNGKPVYCSDCFENVEKDRDNGDFSRAPGRNFDRPRFDKPAYSPRREAPQAPKVDLSEINQKLDELNDKLDLVLHTLTHTPQE